MAAEQGSGKGRDNVLVVINPKAKHRAIKWLIEEYPKVLFQEGKESSTSVNVEQYQKKARYNKDLKLFLKPILNQKNASNVKGYGKQMK